MAIFGMYMIDRKWLMGYLSKAHVARMGFSVMSGSKKGHIQDTHFAPHFPAGKRV